MRYDLGVRLGLELVTQIRQFATQLLEVFDDAVMNNGNAIRDVRMRVGLVGAAVSGLAGMPDPNRASKWLTNKQRFEVSELTLGAPSPNMAVDQRGDTRGIIAAIFEALERFDEHWGYRLVADDADDPTHLTSPLENLRLRRWHRRYQN
jgi:hypothetical protein